MSDEGKLDPISEARIRDILVECSEHAKGLAEFPARMSDGPGAVSALYTSLSFADIIGLCNRALAPVPTNTVGGEDAAQWQPVDEEGHAELRVNGRRITTFPSYSAAEEAAQRINSALYASPDTTSRDSVIRTEWSEAGFVEFINEDVPTIVRDLDGPSAILLDMNTRKVVGYRVYDPAKAKP